MADEREFLPGFKEYSNKPAAPVGGDELLRQSTSQILKDANLAIFLLKELLPMAKQDENLKDDSQSFEDISKILAGLPALAQKMDHLLVLAKNPTNYAKISEDIQKILNEIKVNIGTISTLIPTEVTQTFDIKTPENQYNMSKNILIYALSRIKMFGQKLQSEADKAQRSTYAAQPRQEQDPSTIPKPKHH